MSDDKKQVVAYDTRGAEQLTKPFLALLNSYPDLMEDEKIVFGDGSQESGIALYPVSSALVLTRTDDITGWRVDECQYMAYLIYKVSRDSGANRISIKDFLDDIGRWIEDQDYSGMSQEVKVTNISRQTASYLDSTEESGVENWAIQLLLEYTRTYEI